MNRRTVLSVGALIVLGCAPLGCQNTLDLTGSSSSTSTGTDNTAVADSTAYASTVTEAQADNADADAEVEVEECTVDSAAAVAITLNGSVISSSGSGVTVSGTTATITLAGTYSLSGNLTDGQILVDAGESAIVKLILNGADIRCSTSAPIYIRNADLVNLVLADGTSNYLRDGTAYVLADPTSDEPNAALFSTAELVVCGSGALTVDGRYNDGIASKDGLIINTGTITVNATDDGIRGKDYVVMKGGTITISAGGDGMKSDHDTDATKGYVEIEAGTLQVTSARDAIVAQTDTLITGGTLTLTSGGGSGATVSSAISAKGIKGGVNVIIEGGAINVSSVDDAVHSSGTVTINGGTLTIASGDDGVHADAALTVNGGITRVTKCYEGLESRTVITVNSGEVYITASDDGLNVAGGQDGSAIGVFPGMGGFEDTGNYHMYIHGGRIVVHAYGDGIDCNGPIEMSGGTVLVDGPTANDNGALDYGQYFTITGGFLLATGSAGMAQAPSSSSTQRSVKVTFSSNKAANSLVSLRRQGEDVFTFAPTHTYRSVVFSAPSLAGSTSYVLYTGGNCTGTAVDGLYSGGTYSPGTSGTTFTVSGTVTNVSAP